MTGWALFHVCPWILHPFCQRERTLWGITTPLLAGFSFDLVSAKAPRHTWFWSHALLNDGIMKLCVCTFLSLSFLGSFVENRALCLILMGLCKAGASWRCCPEGKSESQGFKTAWWTSALLRVVNEYGNADQISCPATGYSLLLRIRVRDMRLPAQISLGIWLCALKV